MVNLFFVFPFIADANDSTFFNYAIRSYIKFISGRPEEANVWRGFDVKE
jgi:hypothetical protein